MKFTNLLILTFVFTMSANLITCTTQDNNISYPPLHYSDTTTPVNNPSTSMVTKNIPCEIKEGNLAFLKRCDKGECSFPEYVPVQVTMTLRSISLVSAGKLFLKISLKDVESIKVSDTNPKCFNVLDKAKHNYEFCGICTKIAKEWVKDVMKFKLNCGNEKQIGANTNLKKTMKTSKRNALTTKNIKNMQKKQIKMRNKLTSKSVPNTTPQNGNIINNQSEQKLMKEFLTKANNILTKISDHPKINGNDQGGNKQKYKKFKNINNNIGLGGYNKFSNTAQLNTGSYQNQNKINIPNPPNFNINDPSLEVEVERGNSFDNLQNLNSSTNIVKKFKKAQNYLQNNLQNLQISKNRPNNIQKTKASNTNLNNVPVPMANEQNLNNLNIQDSPCTSPKCQGNLPSLHDSLNKLDDGFEDKIVKLFKKQENHSKKIIKALEKTCKNKKSEEDQIKEKVEDKIKEKLDGKIEEKINQMVGEKIKKLGQIKVSKENKKTLLKKNKIKPYKCKSSKKSTANNKLLVKQTEKIKQKEKYDKEKSPDKEQQIKKGNSSTKISSKDKKKQNKQNNPKTENNELPQQINNKRTQNQNKDTKSNSIVSKISNSIKAKPKYSKPTQTDDVSLDDDEPSTEPQQINNARTQNRKKDKTSNSKINKISNSIKGKNKYSEPTKTDDLSLDDDEPSTDVNPSSSNKFRKTDNSKRQTNPKIIKPNKKVTNNQNKPIKNLDDTDENIDLNYGSTNTLPPSIKYRKYQIEKKKEKVDGQMKKNKKNKPANRKKNVDEPESDDDDIESDDVRQPAKTSKNSNSKKNKAKSSNIRPALKNKNNDQGETSNNKQTFDKNKNKNKLNQLVKVSNNNNNGNKKRSNQRVQASNNKNKNKLDSDEEYADDDQVDDNQKDKKEQAKSKNPSTKKTKNFKKETENKTPNKNNKKLNQPRQEKESNLKSNKNKQKEKKNKNKISSKNNKNLNQPEKVVTKKNYFNTNNLNNSENESLRQFNEKLIKQNSIPKPNENINNYRNKNNIYNQSFNNLNNNPGYGSNYQNNINNYSLQDKTTQSHTKNDVSICFTKDKSKMMDYWKTSLTRPSLKNYVLSSSNFCYTCCRNEAGDTDLLSLCCQEMCNVQMNKIAHVSVKCVNWHNKWTSSGLGVPEQDYASPDCTIENPVVTKVIASPVYNMVTPYMTNLYYP